MGQQERGGRGQHRRERGLGQAAEGGRLAVRESSTLLVPVAVRHQRNCAKYFWRALLRLRGVGCSWSMTMAQLRRCSCQKPVVQCCS